MDLVKPIKLTEADKIRFWEKVNRRGPDDCWEWQACRTQDGYGMFRIDGSTCRAHRVAFVIVNGDAKLQVLHHCDNPPCCNPNHLYAGTNDNNVRDRDKKGRAADHRGEKHGRAKLTEDNVHEIRRLRENGWLLREIAEEYGIHLSQVFRICNGKHWKHI